MANTKIPSELVAINAIQGTLIADNAITAVHVAQNQIHSVQLAINSVTATQIADGTITSAKIADGTIVTADIADGQITTGKIADSSVTTGKIAAGTILGGDIANNAILTQHIDDNQITADQIADNAVGLGQLASLSRGSIIYGDSAGNPAYLAAGSSGHVLTSDGTDISWTADTDLFLATAGGTITGDLTISEATPTLKFTDTDNNYDATIAGLSGSLVLTADSGAEFGTETIQFHAGGSRRATINADGYLLIGKTDTSFTTNGTEIRGGNLGARVIRQNAEPLTLHRRSSDGDILNLYKDSAQVGSIGVDNTDNLTISGNSSHAGLNFSDAAVNPYKNGSYANGTIDLGEASSAKFKDLHLSGNAYIGSSAYAQYFGNSSDTNTLIQFAGSDDIRFRAGGTENMRITATRVGIGVTSPDAMLHIEDSSSSAYGGLKVVGAGTGSGSTNVRQIADFGRTDSGSVSGVWLGGRTDETTAVIGAKTASGNIAFEVYQSGWKERMRITNLGTVLVGKTAEGTATDGIELNRNDVIVATRNEDSPLILNRRSNNGDIAVFRKDNTVVGSISVNGGYLGVGAGDVYLGYYTSGSTKSIIPMGNATGGAAAGTIDLGLTNGNHKFKDLYLSGTAYAANSVAIAKTSLATWSSGYKALQVGGRGFVGAHTGSDLYVGQNASFNSGWKYEASVAASLTQHSGGKITQFVAPAGTAGNAITWNRAIDINPTGEIAMGLTPSNGIALKIGNSSNNSAITRVTNGTVHVDLTASSSGKAFLEVGTNHPLILATNATERMRIGSGGAIDIANNQLGWYDNANSSWQTGVLRFDDLNFKNAGGSSLLLIDGGANTITASGQLSSANGLHSNHHQVYGTGTSGFLISLNVGTNNYAFIMGEIKLEQFNTSSFQTINFSATVLNTGAVQSVKAACDIPVTIKLFNYSNSWYVWVPSPSTFTTCSAYIHMGDGYQGGTRGSNCINTLSHAAVPGSGVTNSTDVVCEQRIKANSSGNVGIGTTSPGAKLEISGKDDAGAGDLLRLQFDNSPPDTGMAFTDIFSGVQSRFTIDSGDTNDLRISSGTKIHLYGGTTNGTSSPHLTVDSSGRVSTPNQPGFLARGNTSQWLQGNSSASWSTIVGGIAHSNGTTIGVNLTEGNSGQFNCYDSGSDFNTSNGRFTAPVDGKYLIHGSIYAAKFSTDANDYMHFLVYVNGQQINQMYTMGGHKQAYAHDFALNISTVLFLEASDYVEWKIYQTSTAMRIYGDHLCIGAHMIS